MRNSANSTAAPLPSHDVDLSNLEDALPTPPSRVLGLRRLSLKPPTSAPHGPLGRDRASCPLDGLYRLVLDSVSVCPLSPVCVALAPACGPHLARSAPVPDLSRHSQHDSQTCPQTTNSESCPVIHIKVPEAALAQPFECRFAPRREPPRAPKKQDLDKIDWWVCGSSCRSPDSASRSARGVVALL